MPPILRPVLRYGLPPLVVGLLLAVLGPYGTFEELSFDKRLLFWVPAVLINWLLVEIATRILVDKTPQSFAFRGLILPLSGSLLVALPATAVVFWLFTLVGSKRADDNFLELLVYVLIICFAIGIPGFALNQALDKLKEQEDELGAAADPERPLIPEQSSVSEKTSSSEQTVSPQTGTDEPGTVPQTGTKDLPPAFARRWPEGLQGDLIFLAMEDHYLRIHTNQGSDLILCRMDDAAHELATLGRRVHRSYWVAEEAVQGMRKDGNRVFLKLPGDQEVPVGKTHRASLKEAGWL
ncbi:LytTR family transcriptional regulator DNA-binding domain-containing protein [Rhodovibrionaceae bacterium A322]